MTTEAKSMLDAVNTAVEPETPVTPPADPVEPEEPIEPVEPAEPAEDKPAEEKPVDDKPVDDKPAGEKPPDDKPADEKPADEKPVEPKKPADPLNDPIPATVSERTRERITSLVSMVKEKDQAIAQRDELVTTIASTGVTPENFNHTLTFLRLFNSPSIEDKRAAYKFMDSEMRALAKQIGEVPPGEDPLAENEDLRNAVEAQSISKELAAELAAARLRTKAADTTRAQLTTQQQEAQAYETARLAGVADLDTLEAALRKDDPAYDAKRAVLAPALKDAFARLHPSIWKETFERAYRNMPAVAAPAPVIPAKPNGGPQPLRANKQPSGDGQKQPSSMLEAMNAGLAQLKG